MEKIDINFCKKFKKKNNPTFNTMKIEKIFDYFEKESLKFATLNYFKEFICLLFNKDSFLIFGNYPNLEVIDEKSKLELLKIIMIYEKMKIKMLKLDSDKYLLYHPNVNKNLLNKYVYYTLVYYGKIKMDLNDDEKMFVKYIGFSKLDDTDLFNIYLRDKLMDSSFWKSLDDEKKTVTINNLEKIIQTTFNKKCKDDKNYLKEMRKMFDIEKTYLDKKLNYNSKQHKFVEQYIKKNSKPFKFPLKQYFGPDHTITYECFKNILDKYEKTLTPQYLNSLCKKCNTK